MPVRVHGEVFGNLYLTDKRGGLDFAEDDEAVIATLAVAAGVAIDNARLYEETQQRQRWLRASTEITRSLLSGAPRLEVVELIARRAREISGAEPADVSVALAGPRERAEELTVEVALGGTPSARLGVTVPVDGTLSGAAYVSGSPVASDEPACDARFPAGPAGRFNGLGAAVAVPLGTGAGYGRGVLLPARAQGQPAFGPEETGPLPGFADQAALALELAERRRDAEQLNLLEDRDRIARDLHDLAIQRLFATGMTLQSAGRLIESPAAADRVARAVADLDEATKIIHSTLFGLRAHSEPDHGLRARATRVVTDAQGPLGFAPRLSMEGLLDTDVPQELAEHVVAVLAEALRNAARHARASRVEVTLRALAGRVVRTVTDDGVGVPEGGRRSVLRNLAERAARVGGSFTVGPGEDGGARLAWEAPIGP
ncbi:MULTISPECIES: histidine kinase [unclassified Kitasatospora]|uniref:sensor histidine kinase n=1 Tax=unclassified Kitasatospora TaxID=2633591 RepID=UPI0033F1E5A4